MNKSLASGLLAALIAIVCSGCASYATPGGRADLASLSASVGGKNGEQTGSPLERALAAKPTIQFPANLAVARLQAPFYRSYGVRSFGEGRFSVVTTREIEKDEDFNALAGWPQVRGAAPIGRMLLPEHLRSDEDLRLAAAKLHADALLLYTFDTTFREQDKARLLTTVTLGLSPNRKIIVTSTASAILLDVRTGFVYGTAESTASESAFSNLWQSGEAADVTRLKVERKAFTGLFSETARMWNGVVAVHRK